MSWSVTAGGKVSDVVVELEKQFTYPLAPQPAGLSDEGERQTVLLAKEMLSQCLSTFDKESNVRVFANGHMGYRDYTTKEGLYQNLKISIEPAE